MRARNRLVFGIVFVVATCAPLLAQYPINPQKPVEDATPTEVRALVSKYCRLDYEGSRLDPQAWSKFQPLVWWTEAPKYSHVDVVARYSVDPQPTSRGGKYVVTVHYRLLGTYDLANGYVT